MIRQFLNHLSFKRFECPVCGYIGPFAGVGPKTGRRRYAKCPQCGALERHRLQFLVLETLFQEDLPGELRVLHFAPEQFIRDYLRRRVSFYETADIDREDVDCILDIQSLPFTDNSYDLIYASHVLEHVPDDERAIQEVKRVLRPGGVAILPVPIVTDVTVEYGEPNPHETDHVRAPGHDYFDRYSCVFESVRIYGSEDFPEKYQTYLYENRRNYPSKTSPKRSPMSGERHRDFVPVCAA